ncbi:hypothetical protein [Alteraurantiacibacter buctensis]|uniref:hypothetical protein n=1 Tax=Alteraurantiacibacter buctensis TaxID=1503981 RepID=UPI00136B95BE|nr:hypothetical protein [Alteraurantiacibacter buctensis]
MPAAVASSHEIDRIFISLNFRYDQLNYSGLAEILPVVNQLGLSGDDMMHQRHSATVAHGAILRPLPLTLPPVWPCGKANYLPSEIQASKMWRPGMLGILSGLLRLGH